ncbi:uncharacterized protein [Nicotiana sylvestris]|uniref:uncharacterized protein n=1 Tax=Nicotiana sylvestris TaxID=4096 RepID=UPI00388CC0FC
MEEQFFEVNRISFSQNDLPPEGAAHKKALDLTVKCEVYYVKRVILDGGSGVDIFPLSTLQRMESGTKRIRPNNVCVRAFDGVKRDTIGEIELVLTIGLVDFEVTFQVLDMDTFYNFLLGRPWIHFGEPCPLLSTKWSSFQAIEANVKWTNERKKNSWDLPQPVPYLAIEEEEEEEEEEEAFMAEEIEDICGAMRKMLYEVYMVQPGKGSSTAEVQYMGPNAKLQNLKATPFPVRWEFWYVFAWSYDEMSGLSVDLVVLKLPNYPGYPPIQQKQRKFKINISDKIKEEVTKQLKPGVIRVVRCTTWLANVVLVPKKDEKTRMCDNYRDLNKARPKDNFPLQSIHILVDNCAKHEIQSFVDCYAPYHQVIMDEEDAEKMAFTIPWGTYCYRVMPFGLKNSGATYMRAMNVIFHDMMHQEIEVYMDDVIIKSKTQDDHVRDLRNFFERLSKYDLMLNPGKCAFRVPSRKHLGFIVSRRGIK